jgi:hypothetical protein
MHGSTCIFWANLTPCSLKHLGEALASGAAAETDVRAAAARLFALRFSVGEFDPPAEQPYRDPRKYGAAQLDQVRERRQVGPEIGPTPAFSSCILTGMHGSTCIFWANLTPSRLGVRQIEKVYI